MIICKTPREIEIMREAGRIVALTHQELKKHIKPGISTNELDQSAERLITKHAAIPTFK
ncbi:M24 family metallopeptidase, partial [Bacillus haynesii]|uniref:M24 family metallopeptidase n=1 Tax=Bacillus haynesii TaxID=1925021 RepID=UPI0036F0EC97